MLFKNKIPFFLLLIVIFNINQSCTEEFFPEIESSSGILVVDGKISNKPGPYEVKLFRTVDIESSDSLIMESGATVIIHCDDGNSIPLIESRSGTYQTSDLNFKGEIGKSYWVEITTIGGKTYESIAEKINSPINIKSIYGEQETLTIDIDKTINVVSLYFDLENPNNDIDYYLWDYESSWEWRTFKNIAKSEDPAYVCYPTETSSSINLYDASILAEKTINHLALTSITEEQVNLNYEYYIKANAYSVSQRCYNFWNNIKKISQTNGNLFDIIPANIYGNVQCCDSEEMALGYFQVSSYATLGSSFNSEQFDIEFPVLGEECQAFITIVYNPDEYEIIQVIPRPHVVEYLVRSNFCYDCSLQYSPTKPSFWP